MAKTKRKRGIMTQDTSRIMDVLEQSVEVANVMLDLIKSGKLSITSVDTIPMLALALGTFYYAYASEVIPLMKIQNAQSLN